MSENEIRKWSATGVRRFAMAAVVLVLVGVVAVVAGVQEKNAEGCPDGTDPCSCSGAITIVISYVNPVEEIFGIRNCSFERAAIRGWVIRDNSQYCYVLPDDQVLEPWEELLVTATTYNPSGARNKLWLDDDQDCLCLYDDELELVDCVEWGQQ